MITFASYLFKVSICSALLMLYYFIFLRNKTYHQYNRAYLLFTTILSAILPLITINLVQYPESQSQVLTKALQTISVGDRYFDQIAPAERTAFFTTNHIILFAFCVISFVMLLKTVAGLFRIYAIKKTSEVLIVKGVKINLTHDERAPFSFLNSIFWNKKINIHSEEGQRILNHELTHVQQNHSVDKLYIELLIVLFWINPVMWFIKKELAMIHEFIADGKSTGDAGKAAFARMILQSYFPGKSFTLTNNFFHSSIKRRLTMITKSKKNSGYIARLFVLPLFILVMAAFSIKTISVNKKKWAGLHSDKKITVVIDAGHGGSDNGAYDALGLPEKELTIAYAHSIKAANSDKNINIVFTREADEFKSPQERSAFINNISPDLLISIHFNNSPDENMFTKRGMEVIIARDEFQNAAQSKLLASSVIQTFTGNFGLPVNSNPMQQQGNIKILQESKCAAVLIEAGYMSNKDDITFLRSDKAKELFADNILKSITQFIYSRKN